ncbi:Hypothetical protein PENO1_029390 [Penicillium occitanis (nom. inval.)]|nr:Hypothetical protein PENO1_029390 [Penicillium occitanis (nom. inval.)]PCH04525.1 hypothetical protein PENOC_032950 [Penicillium occitanis (nom. inval.)]
MRRLFSSPKKASEGWHGPKEKSYKFGGLRRTKTSKIVEDIQHTLTASYWDNLPVELQISIFVECGIHDFLPLKLVCRGFNEVLTVHELAIAQKYLRRRRHGTLPSTTNNERTYTMNPEDDVVLLSDLFPPAKSAKGGYLYTFRYLHTLRRRQDLCARLSYYLANRVMDNFCGSHQSLVKSKFPSKSERDLMFERGTSQLQFKLIPLTYCVAYFLETYASARKEHLNHLLREYEAGRLPVPIPLRVRRDMYIQLQTNILRSPPFNDTATLIATHHCMYLLIMSLLHTLPIPHGHSERVDPRWIGGLLTVSGFGRIVEYFSAEIGDGAQTRTQRKDFMTNFERDMDLNAREEMHPCVYVSPPSGQPHHSSVQEVWLDPAGRELSSRNVIPHDSERFTIWDEIPILIGCGMCRDADGWMAF